MLTREYQYWGLPNLDTKDVDPNFVSKHKYQGVTWFSKDAGISKQHRKDGQLAKSGPTADKGKIESVPGITPGVNEACCATHEMQANFHAERADLFLDMVRALTKTDLPESFAVESTNSANRVPSLYDKFPDGATHNPEDALRYHARLMAESMVHSSRCRKMAEATQESVSEGWMALSNLYDGLNRVHSGYVESYRNMLGSMSDLSGATDLKYLAIA